MTALKIAAVIAYAVIAITVAALVHRNDPHIEAETSTAETSAAAGVALLIGSVWPALLALVVLMAPGWIFHRLVHREDRP